MIVGTKYLNREELIKHSETATDLIDYAISLVPEFARHRKDIVDNQKYIVAVEIRDITSMSFNRRMTLSEALLENVVITGYLNCLFDLQDVFIRLDTTKLLEQVERLRERDNLG